MCLSLFKKGYATPVQLQPAPEARSNDKTLKEAEEKKEETPKNSQVSTTIFKVQKKKTPVTRNTRAADGVTSEDGVTSFSTVLGWVPTWPEFATTKQLS